MPSGRDIHSPQAFVKPTLDEETLARMRAPPDRLALKDSQDEESGDDEGNTKENTSAIPGTFPGGSTQGTDPYY